MVDSDIAPVIKPGAPEVFVVNGKPQWMDEMEYGVGGAAESCDGPGVGWDLRFDENDMKGGVGAHELRRLKHENEELTYTPGDCPAQ